MSYTKQVVHGSFFYFIGAVLAAGIAYLTKLVLVRNLTVEEYGLFFSVFTFVLFFAVFRELGLSQGLARFIADYNLKGKFGEIKSIIIGSALIQLVVSLVVVGVMWLASSWLSVNYFKASEAKWLLRIVSFYLPLSVLHVNINSILQGTKSKWFSSVQFFLNGFVFLLVVVGLYIGLSIYSPALGYLGSFLGLALVLSYPVIKRINLKVKTKNFISENKKLVLFGLPLILTASGALVISYFDTLMLTYFDTVFEVGIYNIIYPTAMLISMIGASIGLILMPVVAELWEKKKKEDIKNAFIIMYKYLSIIIIPLIIVLMMFAEILIRIFFGTEYVFGTTAFKILLIAAIFQIIVTINHQTLIAFKDSTKVMNLYVIGAIVNILLNLILIPHYSLNGAAIATTLSFFIMTIISFVYMYKKIKINIPFKEILIVLITSVIIPLFAKITPLILPNINIYITTIIGTIIGIILCLVIYASKFINIKEVLRLLN